MAIAGLLVHTHPDCCTEVEQQVAAFPQMTTYGIHQECYVVAVAEALSHQLEELLGRVRGLEGVMGCYVSSLSLEDELSEEERPAGEDPP